jgi:hypothetical protein
VEDVDSVNGHRRRRLAHIEEFIMSCSKSEGNQGESRMKTTMPMIFVLIGFVLAGCTASVRETHYFASFKNDSDTPSKPVNFFRLNVEGGAQFSSARYLAGFYDERAVDLFFNEIRSNDSNKSILFKADLKDPGSDVTIKPLSPSTGNGAFVLVMSTSADSIANAIGSFAESEMVAEAITNLIAKEKIKEKIKSDATIAVASYRLVCPTKSFTKAWTVVYCNSSKA